MIASKFGLGQQVRHQLLGFLGVIVDVDPEYSLDEMDTDDIAASEALRSAPGIMLLWKMMTDRRFKLTWPKLSYPGKFPAITRNNRLWMNLQPPSADSCRHLA